MFPTTDTTTIEHPLADLIGRETDGGERLVRFLVTLMEGGVDDAKPYLRLRAARQLDKRSGHRNASEFIRAYKRRFVERSVRNVSAPDGAPAEPSAGRDAESRDRALSLPDLVRRETGDGGKAVRFLIDVMEGRLEGYKPHHRLRAAEELLYHGFDVPFLASLAIANLAGRAAANGPSDPPVAPSPASAPDREARSRPPPEPSREIPPEYEEYAKLFFPENPPSYACFCPHEYACSFYGLDEEEDADYISDLVRDIREDADPDEPLCYCRHEPGCRPIPHPNRDPP